MISIVGVGAVGARLARHLLAADSELTLTVTDLDGAVATRLAAQLGERSRAVDDPLREQPTLGVLAGPCPHVSLAERFLERGVGVVSCSDDLRDVRALLELDAVATRHAVPLVIGAAMSPGLSGLLARHLTSRLDTLDEIHVAMHGTGGPACARQHHNILAGRALGWHDNTWIERPGGSGRELCWFPEPLGAWDCYRGALADPVVLLRAFPRVQRISARVSANRRDRLTARLPMLSPPHREGRLGGLRVEARGSRDGERTALVAGVTERAAIVAAIFGGTMTLAALRDELPAGAVVTGQEDLATASLLERLHDGGLALREFVGTEERTAW